MEIFTKVEGNLIYNYNTEYDNQLTEYENLSTIWI